MNKVLTGMADIWYCSCKYKSGFAKHEKACPENRHVFISFALILLASLLLKLSVSWTKCRRSSTTISQRQGTIVLFSVGLNLLFKGGGGGGGVVGQLVACLSAILL
ncbi:hypothetical protein HanIR_Chr16g0824741 [Helianthus annuus]|nr:hypothetical protein HanIR_Chr16g0824741 [Helianthus annuus]